MRKIKRGGVNLIRSSCENKRAKGEGEKSQMPGDLHGCSDQDTLTELSDEVKSNLSKSVASLALRSGDTVLFACSGIAIERQEYLTRFVTSASLARAFIDANHDDIKIEVRHEGSEVFQGFLSSYNLDRNFSVVKVRAFLEVNVGLIEHAEGIMPEGEVIALARGSSGELTAKKVTLTQDLSESEDYDERPMEAWEGGPLFSFDGNFIGMNLFLAAGRAVYLPWTTILKWVCHFWTLLGNMSDLAPSVSSKGARFGERATDEISNCYPEVCRDALNEMQFGGLNSKGYPKLPKIMLHAGLTLVNTFEDTFGNKWGTGVWRELKKAPIINRSVVALASFDGGKKVFACTGFFIPFNGSTAILTSASLVRNPCDESNVVENLTIKVCLADQVQRKGTLEHCSLHYNVALVSVKGIRDVRIADIQAQLNYRALCRVAAVGRCFESGTLMAARGGLVSWSGRLDCDFIVRSSCKITKAGIGGPLLNMDGKFIGMNFYSKKIGTPFLLWKEIDKILLHFKEKSDLGEVAMDNGSSFWKMDGDGGVGLNRWPVPKPCWCHSTLPHYRYPFDPDDGVFRDEPDLEEIPAGMECKFGYRGGMRMTYLVACSKDRSHGQTRVQDLVAGMVGLGDRSVDVHSFSLFGK